MASIERVSPHSIPFLDLVKTWAAELGFDQLGVSNIDLAEHEAHLERWLELGFEGDMHYMRKHGRKRSRPDQLVPGTIRVICVRMNYWPERERSPSTAFDDPSDAYISRYALGRDYHKLMRKRLKALAKRIEEYCSDGAFRVFVDSAPVLEKALANKAGLGWIGKHSNLINTKSGSYFFLGSIYTDIPLHVEESAPRNHCGDCRKCIDACPTDAIVAPYSVDARRCVSYLTIEHFGPIDKHLRALMGSRIYGCDDCQVVCPWNRFTKTTNELDFHPRNELDQQSLLALFAWDKNTFETKLEGSAIRRIGHERWLRNIATALGNGLASREVQRALRQRLSHPSALVREACVWSLRLLQARIVKQSL